MNESVGVPDNECAAIFQQWTLFFEQFQQTDKEFFVVSMASAGICGKINEMFDNDWRKTVDPLFSRC